jgi:hypothetical protein
MSLSQQTPLSNQAIIISQGVNITKKNGPQRKVLSGDQWRRLNSMTKAINKMTPGPSKRTRFGNKRNEWITIVQDPDWLPSEPTPPPSPPQELKPKITRSQRRKLAHIKARTLLHQQHRQQMLDDHPDCSSSEEEIDLEDPTQYTNFEYDEIDLGNGELSEEEFFKSPQDPSFCSECCDRFETTRAFETKCDDCLEMEYSASLPPLPSPPQKQIFAPDAEEGFFLELPEKK